MSRPDVPACWSWEPLPLPQPSDRGPLRSWQAGRCAVCGAVGPLHEDHDHVTGDTRGYLCPTCNTTEGQPWASPVFELYRLRPPVDILGVSIRYRLPVHPAARRAATDFENALSDGGGPKLLAAAVVRVGLSLREWSTTLAWREDVARDRDCGHTARPHPVLYRKQLFAESPPVWAEAMATMHGV